MLLHNSNISDVVKVKYKKQLYRQPITVAAVALISMYVQATSFVVVAKSTTKQRLGRSVVVTNSTTRLLVSAVEDSASMNPPAPPVVKTYFGLFLPM